VCGIAGFLRSGSGGSGDQDADLVRRMADALHHRGPDDSGVWVDDAAGLAFGHRRLSIIDLSPLGHQPMVSRSGRTVLIYNGEVYNHRELRAELEGAGVEFRSESDTEVILEACEKWGVDVTTSRLIGMFAFAVWDRSDQTLTLVRDRLGIKPLYWGNLGGTIVFASELKALRQHPQFSGEIDRTAIARFLRFNYVPAPYTIYRGIQKLRPASIVTLRRDAVPRERVFWSLQNVVRKGLAERAESLSETAAEERLDQLLRDAVKRRMVADVPLGAFLSGGIDSSAVVALMQAQSDRPVRTFTVGFSDRHYNEAVYAKDVAAHLGTDHTELYVEPSHALDVIPKLSLMYDEPFGDSSQIPTFLISELTRQHVTVALSGDGGDEVFAGYNRYLLASSLGRWLSVPKSVRRAAARMIVSVSPRRWDSVLRHTPGGSHRKRVGDKLHKLAGVMTADGSDMLYERLTTFWGDTTDLVVGAQALPEFVEEEFATSIPGQIEREQYLDTITYLPDDILTKIDRASMAVSLEARVPLLDHRVIEFVWGLPTDYRIRNGKTKWLLRRVLSRYVPDDLVNRPKMGFGVPLDSWLRGPIRDWAEALLDETRLRQEGYLDPSPIREKWEEHISGTRNWHYALWGVLMFQAWLEREQRATD
jgi:asparagine synthase (glutamine-hydrolysing)